MVSQRLPGCIHLQGIDMHQKMIVHTQHTSAAACPNQSNATLGPLRHLVALLPGGVHLRFLTVQDVFIRVCQTFGVTAVERCSWQRTCFVSSDQLWHRNLVFLLFVLACNMLSTCSRLAIQQVHQTFFGAMDTA